MLRLFSIVVVHLLGLLLVVSPVHAKSGSVAYTPPLPELTAIGVDPSYEDLRVSAFGEDLVITREFTDRSWHWNKHWAPVSVHRGGPAGGMTNTKWYLPLTPSYFQSGASITRNDARFVKASSHDVTRLEDVLFVYDESSYYETFGILEAGLIWRDRNGNWIEYYIDEDISFRAMVRRYGNENYSHTLNYDDQTRVSEVTDHFGNTLVTFSYEGRNKNPARIQDYEGRFVEYKYNDKGQLTEYIDARGQSWKYGYTEESSNKKARIASIEDPLGNRTTYEYTHNSTTQTDADGLKTVYNYRYDGGASRIIRTDEMPDGTVKETVQDNTSKFGTRAKSQSFINGELVSQRFGDWDDYEVENELGERTRYKRNQFKKVSSITHPDGSSEKWTYSSDGRHTTSYTDQNDVRTEWDYDNRGRIIEERRAAGRPEQQTVRYSYPDEQTRIINAMGDSHTPDAITTEHLDQFGNVIRVTDAENNTTTYTYNAQGQMLTEAKPSGAVYRYQYDPAGNLTQYLDPLGRITSYTYDAVGNLTTETLPNGAQTTYRYNALNEQIAVTNALGHTTKTIYDRVARIFTVSDARDAEKRVQMNARGLPVMVEDPNGNAIKKQYEGDRLAGIEYPTFKQTYEYTAGSRLKGIIDHYDSKQSVTSLTVDPLGQLLTQTDANNNPEHRKYNAFGQLTEITDALGGITRLTYDVHGNLVKVSDPEGRETRFEYDVNGQVAAEERYPTPSQVSRRTYHYDSDGNLAMEITPNGEKAVYSYNNTGELVNIEIFADQASTISEQTISLAYNTLGQLTSYDDGETQGAYSYDDVGQLIAATTNYGPFSKTISYTYDAAGNVATYTNPEGVTYAYNYDDIGLIRSINIPGTGVIAFSDYQWSQPTRITLPGGTVIDRQYDGLQRMASNTLLDPAQNTLMTVLYGYDPAGNILSQTTEHGDYAYDYDSLYRLISADYPASNDETFGYDGIGNRTSHNGDDSWTYNDANQLVQRGDTSYQYDANGHLIQKTVNGRDTHFIYNSQERLVRVEDHNRQVIAQYGYTPFGHRLWKEVEGERTYFFYNHSGLVGEYNSSGALITEYQYAPGSTWMANPMFQRVNGEVYFYQTDHLGAPQRMVASSGQVVWEARFKAFGRVDNYRAAVMNKLRLPGQYYDDETGLHHNVFRDFDPEIGRYLQSDPLGIIDGPNIYVYARSNPLTSSDPLGLFAFAIPLAPAVGQLVVDAIALGLGAYGLFNMSDKERRREDYRSYKDYQSQGYQRTGDPCKDLKNKIDYHKNLADKKEGFDKKWPHRKFPGGRHSEEVKRMREDIEKWEKELREMCGDEYCD